MRVLRLTLALSLFAFGAAPGFANEDPQARMDAMQSAMDQAQIAASHPGDEALTCEQLQTEMVSTINDPAVQARVQGAGARAQNIQNQMQKAQAGMRATMATGMAMGVASAFVPGMGYVAGAVAQAQMMQQQQQANASQKTMGRMADDMSSIMPQMMRGQRLYELAEVQKCAFIQGPPNGAPVQ